uniref:Uncharacterized protein n=1 Tax=Timema douglasi TaxID=61478 RepID=A0A7R8VWD7_TIMDO|nr:unnamed protein product [Timema douglasi]
MRTPTQKSKSHPPPTSAKAVKRASSNAASLPIAKKRKVQKKSEASHTRAAATKHHVASPTSVQKRKSSVKNPSALKRTVVVVKKTSPVKKSASAQCAKKTSKTPSVKTLIKKISGHKTASQIKVKTTHQKKPARKIITVRKQNAIKKITDNNSDQGRPSLISVSELKAEEQSAPQQQTQPQKKLTYKLESHLSKKKMQVVKLKKTKENSQTPALKSKAKPPSKVQPLPKRIKNIKRVVVSKGASKKKITVRKKQIITEDVHPQVGISDGGRETGISVICEEKVQTPLDFCDDATGTNDKEKPNKNKTKEELSLKKAKATRKKNPKKCSEDESERKTLGELDEQSGPSKDLLPCVVDSAEVTRDVSIKGCSEEPSMAEKVKGLVKKKTKSALPDSTKDKEKLVNRAKVVSAKVRKTAKKKGLIHPNHKVQRTKKTHPEADTIVETERENVSAEVTAALPSSPSGNNDDSSTSDEITLDRLRQQQVKVDEYNATDSPSSPVNSTVEAVGGRLKSEIPETKQVMTLSSFKLEEPPQVPSPKRLSTSEEENLKDMKSKIKVKLECNESDANHSLPSSAAKKVTKKKLLAIKQKEKSSDKNKHRNISLKKEVNENSLEGNSDQSGSISSRDKDESTKKLVDVKKTIKISKSESSKSGGNTSDTDQRARRMKLFGFWSGPKRHRVASLNALAKVHCLYENESRGALIGYCRAAKITKKVVKPAKKSSQSEDQDEYEDEDDSSAESVVCTRTLRTSPGRRGVGKHWDPTNTSSTSSSSSSSEDNDNTSEESGSRNSSGQQPPSPPPSYKQKHQKINEANKKKTHVKNIKKVVRQRRNRSELMMDLKDMVVRKRMASLNASAILAASYSVEKRQARPAKEETVEPKEKESSPVAEPVTRRKKTRKRVLSKRIIEDNSSSSSSEVEVEECCDSGRSVIELRTTPVSNNQVAVIVNQDTDVTITGVYVNSTTRSTHHEGYCSIAGMQYRISSTSHTQTEATAVATETVLHTSATAPPEHPPVPHHAAPDPPLKSYTPLGALSLLKVGVKIRTCKAKVVAKFETGEAEVETKLETCEAKVGSKLKAFEVETKLETGEVEVEPKFKIGEVTKPKTRKAEVETKLERGDAEVGGKLKTFEAEVGTELETREAEVEMKLETGEVEVEDEKSAVNCRSAPKKPRGYCTYEGGYTWRPATATVFRSQRQIRSPLFLMEVGTLAFVSQPVVRTLEGTCVGLLASS